VNLVNAALALLPASEHDPYVVRRDQLALFGLVVRGRGGAARRLGALCRGLPARAHNERESAARDPRGCGITADDKRRMRVCVCVCHAPRPALLLAHSLGGEVRAALGPRRVEDEEVDKLVDETET
jgi:hypothetical protein